MKQIVYNINKILLNAIMLNSFHCLMTS